MTMQAHNLQNVNAAAEIAEDARCAAKEKDAAQEAEHAVNQQLASLEAAHSCDTDVPTPRPPASS